MGGMLGSRFALLYPDAHLILVNPIGLENYLLYSNIKTLIFFTKRIKANVQTLFHIKRSTIMMAKWNTKYAKFANPLIGLINGPDWKELAIVSARVYDMIFTGSVIEEFPLSSASNSGFRY